jgi:hypothetical protein
MKVKLFWKKNPVTFGSLAQQFSGYIDHSSPMEDEINAWLLEHPHIKIADIRQSATGGSWGPMLWLISVWYDEGNS